MRRFTYLALLPQRWRIRRTCMDAFREYRRLADTTPEEPEARSELYARVVAAVCGIDDMRAALDIVRRAEESFAMWPVERPLRLRDVARYLAMTERVRIDIAVSGVSSGAVELGRIIANETIPEYL